MKTPSLSRRRFVAATAAAATGACQTRDKSAASLKADPEGPLRFERLANDPAELAALEQVDIAIIGSGYGGSVLAARLADKVDSLCILERGREWLPGEFPDSPAAAAAQVRYEPTRHLNPLGLYNLHRGDGLNVIVGSGLGGGSLINANVAIRPSADLFGNGRWPAEVDLPALTPHYQKAEETLAVEQLGSSIQKTGFSRTNEKLNLTVNFSRVNGARNAAGVTQVHCTLCGDCMSGCNVGAKNTLPMNYLALAKSRGAKIFTETSVTRIEKDADGGYRILYGNGRVLRARMVVVAAGTLGSTEILLRSRARLTLSDKLGERFSGNGDVVGLAYNLEQRTNMVGVGRRKPTRAPDYDVGPAITVVDRYENYVIEDLSMPMMLADGIRAPMALASKASLGWSASEFGRLAKDLLPGFNPTGAQNSSAFYLGVGRDKADGRLVLEGDGVQLDWPEVRDDPVYAAISEKMASYSPDKPRAFRELGRWLNANGLVRWPLGDQGLTAHPLGGCAMGTSGEGGVVDHRGRVFDGGGAGVHAGLYVADGSIIPSALGVNPFLTITALAERIAEQIAQLDLATS